MSEASTITAPHDRHLARFAWGVLAYFIAVVLWGALVRATGSGGGCGSSWPLCNGYVNPLHHPRLATIIEFAHRQSTTVASLLMAGLVVWTFRVTRRGALARKAALWTVFFLVLEALLGAMLVLRRWVENNDSTGRVIAQGTTQQLIASLGAELVVEFAVAERQAGEVNAALLKAIPMLTRIVTQADASLLRPGTPPSPGRMSTK